MPFESLGSSSPQSGEGGRGANGEGAVLPYAIVPPPDSSAII